MEQRRGGCGAEPPSGLLELWGSEREDRLIYYKPEFDPRLLESVRERGLETSGTIRRVESGEGSRFSRLDIRIGSSLNLKVPHSR